MSSARARCLAPWRCLWQRCALGTVVVAVLVSSQPCDLAVSRAWAGEGEPTPLGEGVSGEGWLGVGLRVIGLPEAQSLGWERPLVGVEMVFAGSPAALAGVERGDVLLHYDGVALTRMADLVAAVRATAPGSTARLSYWRAGEVVEVTLMVGLRPEGTAMLRSHFIGQVAPEFTVFDVRSGEGIVLSELRGQVVVVDFFATWCGPCLLALPGLDAMAQRFADRGVVVLSVSDESVEELRDFATASRLSYALCHDGGAETKRRYMVTALPTVFLVDPQGQVAEVWIGQGAEAALEAQIEVLLQAK